MPLSRLAEPTDYFSWCVFIVAMPWYRRRHLIPYFSQCDIQIGVTKSHRRFLIDPHAFSLCVFYFPHLQALQLTWGELISFPQSELCQSLEQAFYLSTLILDASMWIFDFCRLGLLSLITLFCVLYFALYLGLYLILILWVRCPMWYSTHIEVLTHA